MTDFDINLLGNIEQTIAAPQKKTIGGEKAASFFAQKSNVYIAISAALALVAFFTLLTGGLILNVVAMMTTAEIEKTENEISNQTIVLQKAKRDHKNLEQKKINLIRQYEILHYIESRHFDWSRILEDIRNSIPQDVILKGMTLSGESDLLVRGKIDNLAVEPVKSIAYFTLNLGKLGETSYIKDVYMRDYIGQNDDDDPYVFQLMLALKESEKIKLPDSLSEYFEKLKAKDKAEEEGESKSEEEE